MKAVDRRPLYKLKLRLPIEIDLGSSVAAVSCIRVEREVLTIVDEYDSSFAQMDLSQTKIRDPDKRFSGEQAQYTLVDKRAVDQGLKGRCSTSCNQGSIIYSELLEEYKIRRYQELVRALQYLVIVTRYDNDYSIDQLSRPCNILSKPHLGAAKIVRRYFKDCPEPSITYRKGVTHI